MNINLIASIIFILQISKDGAWNKKIAWYATNVSNTTIYIKQQLHFTFIPEYFGHYMVSY